MTHKTAVFEDISQDYIGLGGRGLTSTIINKEVSPTCDPLGPENKLIFAPGILSGTNAVNTSRLSIGAKSPLTGGIKESNTGGTIATNMGKFDIAAIIVEGQLSDEDLLLLRIDENEKASLISASELKGMRTYALVEKLLFTYGENNSVVCIGPAGEFQLSSASIQSSDVDGRPCRSAGRGGLGAVMGSKGLKAIVLDNSKKKVQVTDAEKFKEAASVFAKAIKNNVYTGKTLPSIGTASLVSTINSLGAFPSYNATKGTFDNWKNISGEKLAKLITERGGKTTHIGCSQCIAKCSNVFVDENSKYVTSSLEYETIWSMGGMIGIDDLDSIATLDFMADDIGIDTMNTGVSIAVAMDAGYKDFGDSQAAIDMLEEIAQGTEIGKILGNGPDAVGKHFKNPRVPTVKGQSIAAYDPRGMQGIGVTYATSPMGADHTAGNLIGEYLSGKLNPLGAEGQVQASRKAQIAMAANDCTGVCLLVISIIANPKIFDAMMTMINLKMGTQLDQNDYINFGIQTLKVEREFNQKAGLTNQDDRLPKYFQEEPLPPHNKVFLVPDEELDSLFK